MHPHKFTFFSRYMCHTRLKENYEPIIKKWACRLLLFVRSCFTWLEATSLARFLFFFFFCISILFFNFFLNESLFIHKKKVNKKWAWQPKESLPRSGGLDDNLKLTTYSGKMWLFIFIFQTKYWLGLWRSSTPLSKFTELGRHGLHPGVTTSTFPNMTWQNTMYLTPFSSSSQLSALNQCRIWSPWVIRQNERVIHTAKAKNNILHLFKILFQYCDDHNIILFHEDSFAWLYVVKREWKRWWFSLTWGVWVQTPKNDNQNLCSSLGLRGP